ncbi:MAG: GNAT family N-acetyltransferase [Alphaproteobacteria bacterium]
MTIEPDSALIAAFWREAAAGLGLDPSKPAPHFHFDDTPAMASDLADEVVNGTKRATAGLLAEMEAGGEPLPAPGGYWIVIDGAGQPRAVIRTLETRIAPFHEVDAAFAWDEGEGDRSLVFWRNVHVDYFQRCCARLGRHFAETLDIHFERFGVVWPKEAAERPIVRRPCTPEEWAAYHHLRRTELFEPHLPQVTYDPDFPDNWTRAVFHVGLIVDGALSGCVQLRRLSETEASIELVAVERHRRGRGLGRKMLEELETFAGLQGCRTLRVFANPNALGFYEKLDFEHSDDDPRTPLDVKVIPLKKPLSPRARWKEVGAAIRPARIEEAGAIAELHVRAWHEAYTGLVPQSLLDGLSVERRAERWRRTLAETVPEDETVLVAVDAGGGLAGFASCGAQRSPELEAGGFDGEILTLYLSAEAKRQGIGRRLMAAMAAALQKQGRRGVGLWVLEGNQPARHFYESLGGEIVGKREDRRGEDLVLQEVAYGWRDLETLSSDAGAPASRG